MKRILVVSDVDGCLTDGGMYYTSDGKVMKKFSAGDHEGLKWLKLNGIDVEFITADNIGLDITKARIKDMSNSKLTLIKEIDRKEYFKNLRNDYDYIIFFGDGLGDAIVKRHNLCDLFVCPEQAHHFVRCESDLVSNAGGNAAFLSMAYKVLLKLKNDGLIEELKELY